MWIVASKPMQTTAKATITPTATVNYLSLLTPTQKCLFAKKDIFLLEQPHWPNITLHWNNFSTNIEHFENASKLWTNWKPINFRPHVDIFIFCLNVVTRKIPYIYIFPKYSDSVPRQLLFPLVLKAIIKRYLKIQLDTKH